MDNFRYWWYKNNERITWFLIGWLTLQGFDAANRGDWSGAAINWGVAVINYFLNKRND